MKINKTKSKLFSHGWLIILSAFLVVPVSGSAEIHLAATTTNEVPVRKPAPVRINTGVSSRQIRPAGQQPTCSGTPLPDIVLESLLIDGPQKEGQRHYVNVTVVNHGQCATGKFGIKATMRIQAAGVDKKNINLGTKGAPSLQPCRSDNCSEASYSTSFSFIPAYNHANYAVTVEVDSGNSVKEFRENNNTIRDELTIQHN